MPLQGHLSDEDTDAERTEGHVSKLAIVIEIQCCRIAPIEDIDLVMIFLVNGLRQQLSAW